MSRNYNFCAGPAAIPEEVLSQLKEEIPDWKGKGLSVMEMSHRSKEFVEIAETAKQDFIDLLSYKKFSIIYGLRMDNVKKLKGNIVIKIDDADYNATNPGVWCWSVRDMINEKHFTEWKEYTKDKII